MRYGPCDEGKRNPDNQGKRLLRAAIVVAAELFLAMLSGVVVGAHPDAAPVRPLRVVTFNLFHGGPLSGLTGDAQHLEGRLQMVGDELEPLHADVIGLQEASWSRQRGYVAARLADRLGFHYVYGPASSRFFGYPSIDRTVAFFLNFTEGPAILSRFPILNWQVDDLPRCGRLLDSRVLLSATLQTAWGPLRVFSAHTRGDPCQTRRVAELVRERRSPLPSVLMGDFNAGPESRVIAMLTQGTGFIDAFKSANSILPGLTVLQQVDAPAAMVRRRGDYIFLVPGITVPAKVVSARVVLNTPRHLPNGTTLWPSDHYGVLAELDLPAARAR